MNKNGIAILAAVGLGLWLVNRKYQSDSYLLDVPAYSNENGGFLHTAYGMASGDFSAIGIGDMPNADRQISTMYLTLLKRMENGVKAGWNAGRGLWYPHDDGAGNATVAYGHKILPNENFASGVSEVDAVGLLMLDIGKHTAPVQKVKIELTQTQFDAIVDFVYNAGEGSFNGMSSFAKKISNNPLKAFNEGGADAGFSAMKRHYQEVVKVPNLARLRVGLLNRSDFQQRMAYKGIYG